MESQRSLFAIGLLVVSFLLWQEWQKDYGPQPVQPITAEQTVDVNAENDADVPSSSDTSDALPITTVVAEDKVISVSTDSLQVEIRSQGGDVISAKLKKYPVEQGSEEPIAILNNNGNTLHIAQSGLIGRDGPDETVSGRPIYQIESNQYVLSEGEDELRIPLVWTSEDGIKVIKTFVFKHDSHAIDVEYTIENASDKSIALQQYAQLKQTMVAQEGSMFMPTYRGGAYSSSEDRYTKYEFGDIVDENLKISTKAGWVAMLQHYFVAAWVPPQDQTNNLYSRAIKETYATIGFTGEMVSIPANSDTTLKTTLYVGPKDQDTLAKLADNLDLTVDYGFLWWLAQPLFGLLSIIQSVVINWGVTIIIITIIVKGAMYPLTKAQYESMAKLRNLQPKMQALKDRYGDDRQKMSQGMMELYRKEKVNPMGGCFPLLLQMPIFLALYWVLMESVELRHASFIFWITDLSVKDPYFVLPVLTGASMYLLQKLQPMTIQDPMQQKIMQFMPVFMSIFFLWFPAGLVLYWLISNVITLVQAKIIYASMDKKGLKSK
ncbi:membrane protein insertase YidC [Alteromonas sp. a30]|uniref:membrane protein insertase YidC n=1 Tax=Alteromonas sp. a30 TaxID=2730917 RepID=UPI002282079C|nr:membrane protein insertase YidC [Alteromonas sp. a30]MCY7295421.1 membrane protein insertase YidC [Alteromonas sp. a30]